MKTDLKQRYIYAATRCLDEKSRQDVSMEISSLMDDMLLERCGGQEPTDKDVKAVMEELGTPASFTPNTLMMQMPVSLASHITAHIGPR